MNDFQRAAVVRVLLEEGAMSEEVFAAIVDDYADVNGPGKLAAAQKVPPSTVMRWARGTSVPGSAVRQTIVDWIWEQVES